MNFLMLASYFLLLDTKRYMQGDAVEDIKQRLSIDEVVGDYVELKRSGRNLKALSPFGNEKTPSFMVSPEKQIWHDFSSNKGGDMFSFVMEMEGVDFRGALEILARKAGLDLSQYQSSGSTGTSKLKARLYEALDLAARYYQQALVKSPSAAEYLLKKRAFTKVTLQDFRLGYAPEQFDGLLKALKKKGFTDEEIKKAGLATMRRGGLSDMFRGRIMVPLMDPQGAVIGFTARLLNDDPNAPKYINTPQTLLYDKSRHVYGLSQAKQAIRAADYVVMVEGNLDVIASHQAGVKQVIATAGTALTDSHLKTLSRFSDDIRIAFDQDGAGLRATERAVGMAARTGIKLSVIEVPEGKDPDELVRKSPEAWQEAVTKPVYAVDWLRLHFQKSFDVTTSQGKRLYTDAVLRVVALITDPVEREHHLKSLATDVDASLEALQTKLMQLNSDETRKRVKKTTDEEPGTDQFAYQDQLIGLLWVHAITRRVLETLDEEPIFAKPERQQVFEYIALHPHDSFEDQIPEDLQNISNYVKIITLLAEELYAAFDANERLREAQDLVRRLQKDYKKQVRQSLTGAIRAAESRGDDETVAKLLAKFNEVRDDKE